MSTAGWRFPWWVAVNGSPTLARHNVLMHSLGNFIQRLVLIYTLLILAAVGFSWVRRPHSLWLSRVRDFVDSVTTPYLGFFRRLVPPLGGLDLSPMLALIVLQVAGGAAAGAAAGI